MFRFLKCAFLIVLLVAVMAVPAAAAPAQQGCGNSQYCITILVWMTCGYPGTNPPDHDYHGDIYVEIERMYPVSWGDAYPLFAVNSGVWDVYRAEVWNNTPGSYRVRWRELNQDGWPSPGWSNWSYKNSPAEPLTFSFWKYDGVMADGYCD